MSRVLHLAGWPFKKFVSISALFIICWFRFSDIDIDIRIPVLGDQHAFRGRMAMFAVLVVTMRHHLFAADDEGLIDSKSIDLF